MQRSDSCAKADGIHLHGSYIIDKIGKDTALGCLRDAKRPGIC